MPTDSERLTRIETLMEDMHHRLFGNGQPGAIDRLDSRVGALEAWRWKAVGGLILSAALIGWAVEAWAR